MPRSRSHRLETTGDALRWLGGFTALGAAVLLPFLLRYGRGLPPLEGAAAVFFFAAAVAGHAFTLAAGAAMALLPLALLRPGRRALPAAAVALFSALTLLLFIDAAIYRLYRFHMNGMVWELLTGGAAGQILHFSAATYATSAALAAGLVAVFAVSARIASLWAASRLLPRARAVLGLFAAALVAANGLHAWADAAGYRPILRQVRALPLFKPLTAKRFLRSFGQAVAAAPSVKFPSEGTFRYPLAEPDLESAAGNKNVLLIFVDGWRRTDFTAEVTPNIWGFSRSAQIFEDHWSTGNATRFGVFGFFYGLHGTYWHDALAEERPPVLLETASKRGYDFAVYASAPLVSPEFDRTVFAGVRGRIPLETPGDGVLDRDREITRRFLSFLENRPAGKPFFGFLFYDAPHAYAFPPEGPAPFTPYAETINHFALDEKTDPLPIVNKLRNSYHFVDAEVGRVLEALEARGLLDETVVVVTSDHGEEANDSRLGLWGHNSAFDAPQARVPFILREPGREHRRFTHRTSHVDVSPTLLAEVFGSRTDPSLVGNGRLLTDTGPRERVVVSSWESYALVGKDRVDVVLSSGALETRHGDYSPWDDAPPATETLLAAMRDLSRFYAR